MSIRVNTLLLMLLIEGVILFAGLTIYMFLKGREQLVKPPKVNKQKKELMALLEEESNSLEMQVKDAESSDDDDVGAAGNVARLNIKLNIVRAVMEGLEVGASDLRGIWDNIYSSIKDVLRSTDLDIPEPQPSKASPPPTSHYEEDLNDLQEIDSFVSNGSEADHFDKASVIQKQFIIELLGYKELFSELEKQLQKSKASNEDLMNKLEDLATNSEEVQLALTDIEKSTKHIEKLTSILKKETGIINQKIDTMSAQAKEKEADDAGDERTIQLDF